MLYKLSTFYFTKEIIMKVNILPKIGCFEIEMVGVPCNNPNAEYLRSTFYKE